MKIALLLTVLVGLAPSALAEQPNCAQLRNFYHFTPHSPTCPTPYEPREPLPSTPSEPMTLERCRQLSSFYVMTDARGQPRC